ncbi:RNA polymerase sigma factor [Andreprevotia chitinilytica]|uniref:RNA polymerase sigma factor n=1 Tax=Andreprevotia chitinilytica TaxID=396808 RepID=UPI0005563580|nr:RNA polymerase sigma factor [Andreprevotia chitinilytica]
MPASIPDEELLVRYRDGDTSAFAELYQRHRVGLHRFIHWQCPRADWAEEIAQDSWKNVIQAADRYEASASFKTWLYQIARNRLIDLLRQQQPVLASDLAHDDAEQTCLDRIADETAGGDGPEATLDRQQQADQLHAAIRTLPNEQREALVLQQFSGLEIADIASLTGVSTETAKSRLRYAMQKLRSLLTPSPMPVQEERG